MITTGLVLTGVPATAVARSKPEPYTLGTQKAHKHKHFMGISLPYWPSF